MEGDFSPLGYSPQDKQDLKWGYYIMNFIPECWDVLRLPDITHETDFITFSHPNKDVCGSINEVVFNLNEFTINKVMRTMVIIAKHGWNRYKQDRLQILCSSK